MNKIIDNIRQLNELGELPNFTDDIVGVGVDSDSPNIVQKKVSYQMMWYKTCRNSKKKYREEEKPIRGGY